MGFRRGVFRGLLEQRRPALCDLLLMGWRGFVNDAVHSGSREAVFSCDLAQALAEPVIGQGHFRLAAERRLEKYGRENTEKNTG